MAATILAAVWSLAVGAEPSCGYDPESGKPNPLGMRAFITATESDGATTFVYEQFPTTVAGASPVTIAVRRELTFHDLGLAAARALLRDDLSYYQQLIGYADSEGFAPYDDVMVCD